MPRFLFRCRLVLLLILLGLVQPVLAQRTYYNWYFPAGAGLTFITTPAQALANNPVQQASSSPSSTRDNFYHSTISDSLGRLQFVTSGTQVWDRTGQLMPNGQDIGVNIPLISAYAGLGAMVLPMALPWPGRPGYYLVLQNTSVPAPYVCPDFYYSVVDMRLRGGLGDVVGPAQQVLLPPLPPLAPSGTNCYRSNMEAIRHANGRDLWLVFRNGYDRYYSYLLTAAGIMPQPVISNATPRATFNYGNCILKTTTDGRRLACSEGAGGTVDIEDFNPATGRVVPRYRINIALYAFGLALSPDGSKLYVTNLTAQLLQYNLSADAAAAVEASRQVVAEARCTADNQFYDLQLGPDGCLYVREAAPYVGRIRFPNIPGRGCRLEEEAVALAPGSSWTSLVRLPNDLNMPPPTLQAGATVLVGPGLGDTAQCGSTVAPVLPGGGAATKPVCTYQPAYFYATASPFVSASSYTWDFGDPGSGARNQGGGQAPTHRYTSPGTYQVQLIIRFQGGRQQTLTQSVEVQDCLSTLPNIITPDNDGQNQAFVLQNLDATEWGITIYNRWGREVYRREPYDNSWTAEGQPSGLYYYLLTHRPTGQRLRGWVEVVK